MFSKTLVACIIALLPAVKGAPTKNTSNSSVEIIYEFPLGTWIENLVFRTSGSVLAIDMTQPNIYEVPISKNSIPVLIHNFEGTTGVSSIAESSDPEVYFAIAGNFTFSDFKPVAGSSSIYKLDFNNSTEKPQVIELAALPSLIMPNGMITIPRTPYILVADSIAGIVYRFDTSNNNLSVYLNHTLLKPSGTGLQAGVNGIKLSQNHFYFSNTNQELIARIRISGKDATPRGTPEIMASQTVVDDFIVNDRNGDLYIAVGFDNELGFVSKTGPTAIPSALVGNENSTILAGPTAVVWAKGKEGKTLIVSTSGGTLGYLTGNHTIGGSISLVNL